MGSENKQKAGDNSSLTQTFNQNTYNYVTVNGITEARAREIFREELSVQIRQFVEEARRIAESRGRKFEDIVIPKLSSCDNSMCFFAKPEFLFLLREAMDIASCTDKKSDYELLSQLLVDRVEVDDDMRRTVAIRHAIRIANEVTDETLVALSVFVAFFAINPESNDLSTALGILDNSFEKILDGIQLPSGTNWMEHLYMLQAIRIGEGFKHFVKIKDFMPTRFSNFFVSGIKCDAKELADIRAEFEECGISDRCIMSHPLRKGYAWLANPDYMTEEVISSDGQKHGGKYVLSPVQQEVYDRAKAFFGGKESKNADMKELFMHAWNTYSHLKIVSEWMDSLEPTFMITPVGYALSDAYIHGKVNFL